MTLKHATLCLRLGADYPYDAPDAWWASDFISRVKLHPSDWAYAAARGVVADLHERDTIKQALKQSNETLRKEIVESLAEIIRLAYARK